MVRSEVDGGGEAHLRNSERVPGVKARGGSVDSWSRFLRFPQRDMDSEPSPLWLFGRFRFRQPGELSVEKDSRAGPLYTKL